MDDRDSVDDFTALPQDPLPEDPAGHSEPEPHIDPLGGLEPDEYGDPFEPDDPSLDLG